jgi:hypothetical protein
MTRRRKLLRLLPLLVLAAAGIALILYHQRASEVGPPTFTVIYSGDTSGYLEDCG